MSRPPRRVPGIENRRRARGRWTFRVRWTDPATGQRMSEEFDDQQDAVDFKAALRLARRSGRLPELGAGKEVLRVFVSERYWPNYATVNLERKTLASYASTWNLHLNPYIGHLEVRQVNAEVVATLRRRLEDTGIEPPTVVKALGVLSGIFRQAVLWRAAPANPVPNVAKPQVVKGAIKPPPPFVIEQIAAAMPTHQERLLVYLVAYERLRPEEALALQEHHVRDMTLLVEQKNVDGEILPYQKVRGKPPRTVGLFKPIAQEIAALRLERGRCLPGALLIHRTDGTAWREHDYRNWRQRHWQAAAVAAGVGTITIERWVDEHGRRRTRRTFDGPKPYWLRHAGVSLLLREGRLSLAELAEENGHSIQTLHRDYAHVIAELKGQPNLPVEQQIIEARRKLGAAA